MSKEESLSKVGINWLISINLTPLINPLFIRFWKYNILHILIAHWPKIYKNDKILLKLINFNGGNIKVITPFNPPH